MKVEAEVDDTVDTTDGRMRGSTVPSTFSLLYVAAGTGSAATVSADLARLRPVADFASGEYSRSLTFALFPFLVRR